jgi:hypothetical protein
MEARDTLVEIAATTYAKKTWSIPLDAITIFL